MKQEEQKGCGLPCTQDAFLDLLVRKGLITKQEITIMAEKLFPGDSEEEDFDVSQMALIDLLEKKGFAAKRELDTAA